MSQAVRQFLHFAVGTDKNETISEAWERLSPDERHEAEELADTTDTMVVEVPSLGCYDLDEILASQ